MILSTLVITEQIDVVDYIYLAKAVTAKFLGKNRKGKIEDSELYSVACLELVKASKSYNVHEGDFDHYAFKTIKNGLILHLRHQKRKKRIVCFEYTDLESLPDSSIEKELNQSEINFQIKKFLDFLKSSTSPELDLLKSFYLSNKSLRDLGKEFCVSHVTIKNRINKVLSNLRLKKPELFNEK